MLGSAESKHLRLTDREIEFQPISSQSINVTDRQTDGRRDDMLCTVVHRAIKTTA